MIFCLLLSLESILIDAPNRQSISTHKLAMGVSHHPINKPPPEYLCWRVVVKDQMLARGCISDNWHFPDAEFQQIVEGMRRLKPVCDELATASADNNMASMQEIDEAVLRLVKDCGKKLANTIRTNNQVPPPGSGVSPAQVIVRPMLLPLNAPPQCQWSIAMAVVPNAGPVGQNARLGNAPGQAQAVPAPPAGAQAIPAPPVGAQAVPAPLAGAQAVPAPLAGAQAIPAPPAGAQALPAPSANPQAQNIATPPGPADPEAQNDPPPPGPPNPQDQNTPPPTGPANPQDQNTPPHTCPANPQRRIGLRLGNLYRQRNGHQPANILRQIQSGPSMGILGAPLGIKHAPANPPGPINRPGPEDIPVQIQSGPSMGILGTPLGIKHAPANAPSSINLPGPEDIPVQIQADPPMGILGRQMGMRHAPLVDIPEAVALNVEDPFIQYFDVARRVRRAVSGLSKISEFFWQ